MSHNKQVDFLYEVKLLNSFFRLHLWEADLGKLSSDISDLEAAIPEVVVKTLKSIRWKWCVNRSANMLVFAKSRGVLIRAYKYLIYIYLYNISQEALLNRFVSELKAPETIVIRKRLRKSRRTSRKPQRWKTAKGRTEGRMGQSHFSTLCLRIEIDEMPQESLDMKSFKSSWQLLEIFSLICIDAWHVCSIPYQTVLTGSWRGTCRIRHGSRGVPASAMDLIRFFSARSKGRFRRSNSQRKHALYGLFTPQTETMVALTTRQFRVS